jgi:hypothetical protein
MRKTKSNIIEFIEAKLNRLEYAYDFTPMNGSAQVDGKGEELNRLYGEYDCLQDLRDWLEQKD